MKNPIRSIFRFYYEGFRSMTVGKKLWLIIVIKLFILFGILKPFFFPNHLSQNCPDPSSKPSHISTQLLSRQTK